MAKSFMDKWFQYFSVRHYLTRIQENAIDVINNPGKWLPWNYKETIDAIAKAQ